MKHLTLAIFSLLFLPQKAYSQSASIKWGKSFSYDNGIVPQKVLKVIGNDIFILTGPEEKGKIGDFYIDIIDKSSLKSKRRIELDTHNLPISIKHIFNKTLNIGNSIFLFSTEVNESETDVFCSKFDIATGKIEMDGKLIGKSNYEGSELTLKDTHTSIFLSKGEKYIVVYNNLPNKTHQNEKIQYTILDSNLVEVNNATITLPYRDRNYHDVKYWVEKNGDLKILGLKKPNKYKEAIPVIFNHSLKTNLQTESVFPLPEWHILSFNFFVNDKTLNYDGLYYDTEEKHTGIYSYEFDSETSELKSKVYVDLENEEMKNRFKEVQDEIRNFYRYHLISFFYTSSDTICYFLENQAMDHSVGKEYIFNDIIAVKTTKNGKVISMATLPKRQMLLAPSTIKNDKLILNSAYMRHGLVSAAAFLLKNKTFLLYNDNKENLNESSMKKVKTTTFRKNSAIFLAEIAQSGNIARKIISELPNEDLLISSVLNYAISENEMLTLGVNLKTNSYTFGIFRTE